MQTNQTNNWQDQQALERYTAIAPLLGETMDPACFLQVLFGQSCKTFLDIVACPNWTKLQSVGQS